MHMAVKEVPPAEMAEAPGIRARESDPAALQAEMAETAEKPGRMVHTLMPHSLRFIPQVIPDGGPAVEEAAARDMPTAAEAAEAALPTGSIILFRILLSGIRISEVRDSDPPVWEAHREQMVARRFPSRLPTLIMMKPL